jgi:hypothetical protein
MPSAVLSLARCQGPLSTTTRPAATWASGLGTSIRDSVWIGATSA